MKRLSVLVLTLIFLVLVAVQSITVYAQSDDAAIAMDLATPGDAEEEEILTGWHKDADNLWKFYDENGNIVEQEAGWYGIAGKYHYLTDTGADVNITEGFHYIWGTWRYLKTDGSRVTQPAGWYGIAGKYHYLTNTGADVNITEGFHYIWGTWRYLKTDGSRVTKPAGWYGIAGKYHYLTITGADVNITEGFHYIWGTWRYLKTDGSRVLKSRGWYAINSRWYYLGITGVYYKGFKALNDNIYYFNSYGGIVSGFFKASDNYWYYQTKNSGIYFNNILKNIYSGNYFYVSENGRVINNALVNEIIKVYLNVTSNSMTREEKLYAMYMYLATYKTENTVFTYERRYDDSNYVGKTGWTYNYAYYMLSNKKGNCYNFACTFAYMAKMLGYNANVLVGQVHATRGGYTPHSMVELIYSNGKSYGFDPELQFANGTYLFKTNGYNGFKLSKKYKIAW